MNTGKKYRPFGLSNADVLKDEEMASLFLELRPDSITQGGESVQSTRSWLLDAYDRIQEQPELESDSRSAWTLRWTVAGTVVLVTLGLIVFLVVTILTHDQAGSVARIQVLRGEVKITRPGRKDHIAAVSGAEVFEKDMVETSAEGLAILNVDDGSAARMDGASSLSPGTFTEQLATFRVDRGRVYFNLKSSTRYKVVSEDLVIETGGAIFDTAQLDGSVRTRVIEGDVSLALGSAPCGRASEGEEALVSTKDGARRVEVERSDPGFLDEPWYRWNRLLDRLPDTAKKVEGSAEDSSPGKRTVKPSPLDEIWTDTTPPIELPPPPDVPPGPGPPPVTPEPVAPEPSPEPQRDEAVEISLSARYDDRGKIELNWTVRGGDDYDSLAIARSTDTGSPGYPGDREAVVAKAASYYKDTRFERGHTYYYRLYALEKGEIRSRSDVRAVLVPEEQPEPTYTITFSIGEVTTNEVPLYWTLGTTGRFEGYIVYRELLAGADRDKIVIPSCEKVMSYTDTDVKAGSSYVYQVVVYSGGQILACGERRVVTIPGFEPTKQTEEDDPPTK
jgi:hypothetical protein